MGQTVQQRGRELFVAREDRDPLREREVAGDHGRPTLVAIREQVEQQLAADPIEVNEPQLVDLCGV
jgi:hypothetical protein